MEEICRRAADIKHAIKVKPKPASKATLTLMLTPRPFPHLAVTLHFHDLRRQLHLERRPETTDRRSCDCNLPHEQHRTSHTGLFALLKHCIPLRL